MASKFINKNSRYNQNKHYTIFIQGSILNKLYRVYVSLVANIDNENSGYTSTDRPGTIYKIKYYLKTDFLKIFYATTIPSSLNSNERQYITLESN